VSTIAHVSGWSSFLVYQAYPTLMLHIFSHLAAGMLPGALVTAIFLLVWHTHTHAHKWMKWSSCQSIKLL